MKLRHHGTGELETIIEEFNLVFEERIREAYILRVTDETGINPIKVANQKEISSWLEAVYERSRAGLITYLP